MLARFNCASRIIKTFESEKEAFAYEFDHVNELKQKGQCVCNLRKGGYGGAQRWWTDELREKYSRDNVMKAEAQRKRMQKDNPMKRPAVAEKVAASKRIPVIGGDDEYPSVKSVSEAFGVSLSTVGTWCARGETSDGIPCRYKGGEIREAKRCVSNGQNKPLEYKGKRYESAVSMAAELGVSQSTVARWCRQGRDSSGRSCRYLDGSIGNAVKQKSVPVIVDGVWYPSKESAARETGISSFVITQYLKGNKRDKEHDCKHANG
jgi:hypothetical protein